MKNIYKFIVAIFIFIGLSTSIFANSSEKTLNSNVADKVSPAKNTKILKVGIVQTPNYFISDDYGTIGFEYDILRNFASAQHATLKISKYKNAKDLIVAANAGKIDIAASHFTKSYRAPFVNTDYFTTNINTEKLVVVGYQLHSQTTVNYPSTTTTVYQPANSHYKEKINQAFQVISARENAIDLFINVAKGKARYALLPENLALSLIQIYPTVKLFTNNTKATVDDTLYIPDTHLRVSFNNYFPAFSKTAVFSDLKYTNLNALKRHFREESRLFVLNMQSKFETYKNLFKKYSTSMDYRLAMAVGYQESRWKADAISPWGPSGLMMLTNASAKILGVTNKLDATQSIEAGVSFLMRLKNKLIPELTGVDRDMFAISNYNLGIARIIDARTWLKKHNLNPNSWVTLSKYYPIMEKDKHKRGKINGTIGAEYMEGVRHWYYMILNYLHFHKEALANEANYENIYKVAKN